MRAVVLHDFKTAVLSVENLPTSDPKPGQVLIKIAAASVNPSDLVFLRNQYGIKKTLPIVPGFEGSGTVVSANAGLYGRWLVGKRVACKALEYGNGTWAEHMTTSASSVIPLKKSVTFEQGAALIVNPLTAWALLKQAKEEGHTSFIQTAASGALGRMIERLGRQLGLVSINIVRRREQVELMKKEGAVHVLDTSQDGWQEQLKVLAERYQVKVAFDAVGGLLSAQMAQAMAKGGRVIVYGALGGENCQINPSALIFEGKRIEGFWVSQWVKDRSLWQNFLMTRQVQDYLGSALKTDVQARFPLDQINDALALYKQRRTDGKVLVVP